MHHPWPWYIAGPLIGLMVPLLLILGNKSFGISSSFRHICASCFPGKISFFKYDWKKESWNLYFVLGIFLGGVIMAFISDVHYLPMVDEELKASLQSKGLTFGDSWAPESLISLSAPHLSSWVLMIAGGFLVGFGTRYAGGCTSGHAIMGLSSLQWPSLVAVVCFMAGGFFATHFILPIFFK
ncbi:MAG: YeeE/YedE family protein [Bacteroidia bacterium]|nr:YeeE/YedE family protein [Bacteroidia bacterium]